jgi:hypothetical protein
MRATRRYASGESVALQACRKLLAGGQFCQPAIPHFARTCTVFILCRRVGELGGGGLKSLYLLSPQVVDGIGDKGFSNFTPLAAGRRVVRRLPRHGFAMGRWRGAVATQPTRRRTFTLHSPCPIASREKCGREVRVRCCETVPFPAFRSRLGLLPETDPPLGVRVRRPDTRLRPAPRRHRTRCQVAPAPPAISASGLHDRPSGPEAPTSCRQRGYGWSS